MSTPTCNRTKPERSIRPLPGCACTSLQFSNLFISADQLSLYLFLPPLSLFLSITSTVSEALVKEPRQNAKVLAADVYRGGRANKPPASHPAGPLLLPVGSARPTVALSECQRDSDKAIKISSSDYNGHSRLHLVCTPTLESSD